MRHRGRDFGSPGPSGRSGASLPGWMAGPGVNPGSGSVLYLSLQAHTPDGLKALHAAAIVRCALSWPALFA